MRVGIHLPQYGKAAGPDAIARAARHAEELGFADVWVSDHLVHPAEQDYPSPFLYDPLMTLCWAAAATQSVQVRHVQSPGHENHTRNAAAHTPGRIARL